MSFVISLSASTEVGRRLHHRRSFAVLAAVVDIDSSGSELRKGVGPALGDSLVADSGVALDSCWADTAVAQAIADKLELLAQCRVHLEEGSCRVLVLKPAADSLRDLVETLEASQLQTLAPHRETELTSVSVASPLADLVTSLVGSIDCC
jgi:hypothetical protein